MCVLAMPFAVSSCSEEEELTIISYAASGNISAMGSSIDDAMEATFAVAEYNEAIQGVVKNAYATRVMDDEVIAACDAVFEEQHTNHPNWHGSVEVRKYEGIASSPDEELSYTVIKTYSYE